MATSKKAGSNKGKGSDERDDLAPPSAPQVSFTSSDLMMLDSMAELVSDWARRCSDRLRWAETLRRDPEISASRREVLIAVQREAARNLFALYDATRPRPEDKLDALEQELRLIIHAIQERGERPLADAAFAAISMHAPLIAHRCDVEMNDEMRCRLYVLLVNDASAVSVWFGDEEVGSRNVKRPHFSTILTEAARILDIPAPAVAAPLNGNGKVKAIREPAREAIPRAALNGRATKRPAAVTSIKNGKATRAKSGSV
ncbi:MAG: hypothetical protein U0165_03650 [Polyangiaceae bacterium]